MEQIIITFSSTLQAMNADEWVQNKKLPARLIPIPGSLRAGCGLGLLVQKEDEEWWKSLLEKEHIAYEQIWKGNFL
jgi:hypothetical protein